MEIRLANPRGFCAGVDRAIEIVNRAIDHFGAPVYVRHEVVHNKYVVDMLRGRGAIFVEELTEIPDDAVVVFSAHGVSRNVRTEGESRPLKIFDATCPLVTKVHIEVQKFAQMDVECILIGHAGHPEVEGTMGQYSGGAGHIHLVQNLADVDSLQVVDAKKLGYVTQTTLSIDDTAEIVAKLKARFPDIRGPRRDDICYATQNRQDAVKQLALECTLVLVVGSPNSSNSNRLMELARRCGTNAFLIDSEQDIQPAWLRDDAVIGVTAGASAPETLVAEVVNYLVERGAKRGGELPGAAENIQFSLPTELRSRR
jgi:4-hydroxy-3-methylbut-2-en-1-yl diphosphate reductase